jgi:hypothetical protein
LSQQIEGKRFINRRLIEHQSPLIRLGVVLGFADAMRWEEVRNFQNDANSTIAQRACELLEDARI